MIHSRLPVVQTGVGGIGEDGADSDLRIQFLENLVVAKQHRHGLNGEQYVVLTAEGRFVVVVENELCNLPHTRLALVVGRRAALIIFDQKTQYILVGNGILDQILVQAFAENFGRCVLLFGILDEDRRTRKSENLQVVEEVDDIFVAVAEVTAVAFVENHYDFFIPNLLQMPVVVIFRDGTIELLNRGDDDFRITAQPLDQLVRVVRIVYRTRLERFVFRLRLRVEVVTVYDEHHLVDSVYFRDQLRRFERGQGLPRACRMPDVTVLVGVLHLVDNLLDGIELIGP